MQRLTPNWEDLSALLVVKLDEIADELNLKIELGEDPALAVQEALADMKLFIGAIEDDPGQFTMRDVS